MIPVVQESIKGDSMKRNYLLKTLVLWIVILFPLWAHAEDLGALRLSQMEGDVQVQSKGVTEWFPAAINLPIQVGDRLWVPKNAWAQVETREGSVIRLDADSSLEILAVEKDSLQVYLSQGQAYLNFKKVDDAMLQMDTPISSIRIYDSSTFNVALAEELEVIGFRDFHARQQRGSFFGLHGVNQFRRHQDD